jgi:hypothetical protein
LLRRKKNLFFYFYDVITSRGKEKSSDHNYFGSVSLKNKQPTHTPGTCWLQKSQFSLFSDGRLTIVAALKLNSDCMDRSSFWARAWEGRGGGRVADI